MIITDTALTIEYSNADAEYMGRFYLLKAFQQLYSDDDSDPEAANFVARKNDFSDLADYFVQKVGGRTHHELIPGHHHGSCGAAGSHFPNLVAQHSQVPARASGCERQHLQPLFRLALPCYSCRGDRQRVQRYERQR